MCNHFWKYVTYWGNPWEYGREPIHYRYCLACEMVEKKVADKWGFVPKQNKEFIFKKEHGNRRMIQINHV